MGKLMSFLEHLKGAGFDVSSFEALGDEDKGKLEGLFGVDTTEYERVKKEAEENEKRYKGMTTVDSQKAARIKELEAQLGQQRVSTGDVSTTYGDLMTKMQTEMDKKYGDKLDQVLGLLEKQTQEAQALQAKLARKDAIEKLAAVYPVLKDPEYHSLIPETADVTVLEERAKTLTKLYEQTQVATVEQMRAGVIPRTAPPRVVPGKPESLDREMKSIEAQAASGQITPQEANRLLDEAMQAFRSTK